MASLTTIAGSTANLKRDPPLTQLTDWLSNYNYPLSLFFPRGDIFGALPPYMCGELSHFLSSLYHAVFEPLLWSWERRVQLVCRERHAHVCQWDSSPLWEFEDSWKLLPAPPSLKNVTEVQVLKLMNYYF